MSESRMIRVLKRDGGVERFDEAKLTASMFAGMEGREGDYEDARELARAVRCYLHRSNWPCVASAAIFEMAMKILRRVRLGEASIAMADYRQRRKAARKQIRVVHDRGQMTAWDKSWLAKLASQSWHLAPRTGRIVAGEVERLVLAQQRESIARSDLIDLLNRCVVEYGLADAVPVQPPVAQT